MIEIRNIQKTFNLGTINEKKALCGVDLVLEDGDFCTVIGGNGAGKSTMLNAIAGTWPVDEGSILIDGEDVTGLPQHKRASFLGRVFQDPMTGTTATMQIDENLALAARRGKSRSLRAGITKAERTSLGNHQGRKSNLQRAVKRAGLRSGRSNDLKGRTSFRRTETGINPSYGIPPETKGSSFG